jgi:hypothetical protein
MNRLFCLGAAFLVVGAFAGALSAEPTTIPPRPSRPAEEDFAAPATDQAGRSARAIADRFAHVPNMRAAVKNSRWLVDPASSWSIRPETECLAELRKRGIEAVHLRHPATLIPTPVVVVGGGPVNGVYFRDVHEGRPLILSCELAARLPAIANIVRRYDVHRVDVLSSFRLGPQTSFHSVGLGLDIVGFQSDRGELNVLEHFVETPYSQTCLAPEPTDWRARTLLDIACALANTHRFQTVLTPNYRRGHRNHFHLDARPNDPRLFLR